jgi:LEA14-like dessication related protein
MPEVRTLVLFLIIAWLLGGCATLVEEIDPPSVSLQSLRPVAGSGMAPDFEITLRVVNPNNVPLDIVGIGYQVEVQGMELVSGVSSDVPRIGAYEEGDVTLLASINTYPLLRLLAEVGNSRARALEYTLRAKIDFSGLVPTQRIEDSGVIDLSR